MSLNKNKQLHFVAMQLCRKLRKQSTKAEKIFWENVRNRKFDKEKFNRQFPIFFDLLGKETFFIADFYCDKKKTVVEIDGKIHDYTKEHDKLRTEIINQLGINVVRFKNEEVENNIESVLKRLHTILHSPQTPLSRERGF